MQLWTQYFHNANPIYALNNRMAAIAAANRLPAGGPVRILEIGAGAGSAAEALLDELRERGRHRRDRRVPPDRAEPDAAAAGEPRPGRALSRAARSSTRPTTSIRPPPARVFRQAGFDLVFAVNVLHIAQDLGASLDWLRSLLVPGGWLVGGECQRLFPRQTIPIELIFEQLASFTQVKLDREVRSSHGFLTPEQWRQALGRHRFRRRSPKCPTWPASASTTRDSSPARSAPAVLRPSARFRRKEPECPRITIEYCVV